MDWNTIASLAAGAFIALAGVGLSELGQWRRAKRAEDATAAARSEDRRVELWQLSLPAAGRVQETLANVARLAREREPEYNRREPEEPFEEGFPRWWDKEAQDFKRDVALIPSDDVRRMLSTVLDGISFSPGISRRVVYAFDHAAVVRKVSDLGFEVVSSWLRDEREIAPELRERVAELVAALQAMHEAFRQDMQEAFADRDK